MKRIFTLFILLSFGLAINAQSDAQRTLVTKRTADWCPRCGTWGWTFVKDGLEAWKDKDVIFWAMHLSGGLSTPTSQEMSDNFGGTYQPVFRVNQDDLNVLSGNVAAKIEEASLLIDALNSFPAIIKVGVTPTMFANDSLVANVEVTFEEGTDTDYTLGIYLIRDNLMASQSGVGGIAVHPNILETALTSTTFGDLIKNGETIEDGETFSFTASLANVVKHNDDLKDLKVAAVLWREVNGQRQFVNGDIQSTTIDLTSNTIDQPSLTFDYTLINDQITVTTENDLSNSAQLQLFNLEGKIITLSQQQINGSQVSASVDAFLTPGAYILRLTDGVQAAAKQIYIVE